MDFFSLSTLSPRHVIYCETDNGGSKLHKDTKATNYRRLVPLDIGPKAINKYKNKLIDWRSGCFLHSVWYLGSVRGTRRYWMRERFTRRGIQITLHAWTTFMSLSWRWKLVPTFEWRVFLIAASTLDFFLFPLVYFTALVQLLSPEWVFIQYTGVGICVTLTSYGICTKGGVCVVNTSRRLTIIHVHERVEALKAALNVTTYNVVTVGLVRSNFVPQSANCRVSHHC